MLSYIDLKFQIESGYFSNLFKAYYLVNLGVSIKFQLTKVDHCYLYLIGNFT